MFDLWGKYNIIWKKSSVILKDLSAGRRNGRQKKWEDMPVISFLSL